jgi:telomere length regulation protein
MSGEYEESACNQIRDIIARLQSPVQDLPTLLGLLTSPLDSLKLLPPTYLRYNLSPLPTNVLTVSKHIPLLQRALLEHVLPAWGPVFEEQKLYELAQQYFAPNAFLMQIPAAKEIALHAYATILSLPLTEHSLRLLTALTKTYPIDILWSATVGRGGMRGLERKHAIIWEDCVRNIAAIPGKIANAFGGRSTTIPEELEPGMYFSNVCRRTELIVSYLPTRPTQGLYQTFRT